MKVNGEKALILGKAKVYKYGKMGHYMKDGGSITKLTVGVDLFMLNVIFMKENG